MCGELNPSFVCSKHRNTPDDWRYWLDEPKTWQEERDERINSYVDSTIIPLANKGF